MTRETGQDEFNPANCGPGCGHRQVLSFFAAGDPKPQGSKRHVGNGIMVESSKGVGNWRSDVAWQARQAAALHGWQMHDGACEVVLTFYVQAPKTRPRELPSVKPDIDKLSRALLDSLVVARVIRDDSRVTDLVARKRYADDLRPLGCDVEVHPL